MGGNAGVGLVYLTGKNCFQLSTTLAAYAPPLYSHTPAAAASPSLYNFIKLGFCSETGVVYGLYKTKYPLVAWTYAAGDQYNANPSLGIIASHCYSILGVFQPPAAENNHSYIVLRTTYGLSDPAAQVNVSPADNGNWTYGDARFPIGTTGKYPPAPGTHNQKTLDLSVQGDAIFGLDQAVFSNYFQSIGWASGY